MNLLCEKNHCDWKMKKTKTFILFEKHMENTHIVSEKTTHQKGKKVLSSLSPFSHKNLLM